MMRKLLTLLLLVGIVFCAAADDRSPRKKRKKEKARTEQAAESPAPEQSAASAPDTQAEEQPAVEPLPTDITLEYTAEQVDSLVAAWREGDGKRALDLQLKYLELVNALFIEVNPIPVKEAMNMLGMEAGPCRLPLCEMEDKNREALQKALRVLEDA